MWQPKERHYVNHTAPRHWLQEQVCAIGQRSNLRSTPSLQNAALKGKQTKSTHLLKNSFAPTEACCIESCHMISSFLDISWSNWHKISLTQFSSRIPKTLQDLKTTSGWKPVKKPLTRTHSSLLQPFDRMLRRQRTNMVRIF